MTNTISRFLFAAVMFLTTVIGLLILLSGCASLHLGIKAKHSSDNTSTTKAVSAHAYDSLAAVNQNLSAQMQQLLLVNVNKNVATTATDEDATTVLHGGSNSNGHTGGNKVSLNQTTHIGRVQASGTYYYANDSIHVSLHIGDTTISIHRHVITTTDLSKINTSKATVNTTSSTTVNTNSVHFDSSLAASSNTHQKQSSTVQVDATASIGGKGYLLAVIALCVGLLVGLFIGRKSRK